MDFMKFATENARSEFGDEMLNLFGDILRVEANEKIKKAIQLFIKSDDPSRRIMLYNTGFSGPITGKALRDHFDTLDLMDALDDVIENMEFNIE